MLKPYDGYKGTDQLWLNSVPKHWDMIKTKNLFSERSSKGFPDEPLLVASQNMGVVPKGVYGNRTVEATKDLHLLKLVKVGDFVISLRSFQGGIEYAYYQGIISPAYTVMIPKSFITANYFRHLAKSKTFIELLQMCVTGIREGQNVDYNKLKNYRLPIPPREEQDQIVKYLDWQTSKINTLIKAKKKQIELLKEQKQAVINQAVTKGIYDTVPMKDSGVEWLGEVPEHWLKDKTIRLFSIIGSGTTPASGNPKYYENATIPWLNSGDLSTENIEISEINKKITLAALSDYSVLKIYEPKTIAIAMYGASIGNTCIVNKCFCVNQACCCLGKPKININLLYAYYCLYSAKTCLIEKSRGGGQPNISQDLIKQLWLPIPPLNEQQAIVEYLEEKTALIDKAIAIIEKEIELVSEYKTSLISSVVTGKVDVRDVIVPDFEVVEDIAENIESDEDEVEG